MELEIKKNNDPILRAPTTEVSDFGMEFQNFVDDMIETMRKANGVGLAAPQVSQSKKVIVCEYKADKDSKYGSFPLTVICNPTIIKKSKELKNMVEGCLSFPGIETIIKRPQKVTVEGVDRLGKKISVDADQLFARVLQHEHDHLISTLLIDHIKEIDIIFIGTGTLGVPALEMLAVDPQYNIKLVITGNGKAITRNHEAKSNSIEQIALKYNLPLLKTGNINDSKIIEKIKSLKPQLGIMADFGQIIGQDVLDAPKKGIINIHPSLLPRHRGPSPVQQTILDGDRLAGVTLILTGKAMDAGGIISQTSVELRGTETTSILKEYLAEVGASLLLNSIPYYLTDDLEPETQDDKKATYNKLFTKNDGYVDLNTSAKIVDRKIRAFCDWPKVYTLVNGKRVLLLSGHFEKDGGYLLDRVKPEGKSEMSYEDFIRGYHTELTFRP